MDKATIYEEKLLSLRTEVLFILLTLVFLVLFIWQLMVSGWGGFPIILLFFFLLFLFYSLNYRILTIAVSSRALTLKFGVFTWHIPLDNIESISQDEVSLYRIGGAGIHFTTIGGRYRAMFNFLEYPRLVIRLKQKRGPVRDIAFSTRHPQEIDRMIVQALEKGEG